MGDQRDFIRFSACDILKRGVGPSSSHTLAPWRAAQECRRRLCAGGWLGQLTAVKVTLYGSLAFVGRGHYTTLAVPLGLLGMDPLTFDISAGIRTVLGLDSVTRIGELTRLDFGAGHVVQYELLFDTRNDADREKLVFEFGYRGSTRQLGRPERLAWYSYGGGSVGTSRAPQPLYDGLDALPFMYDGADSLLAQLRTQALPVSEAVLRNEAAFARWRSSHRDRVADDQPCDAAGVIAYLKGIAVQMGKLIHAGCTHRDDDDLYRIMYATPRAKRLYRALVGEDCAPADWRTFVRDLAARCRDFDFDRTLELVGIFALAVSEQNAALKSVVTAPTNGSCGTLPAVLYYYVVFLASEAEREWLFGDRPGTTLNPILRFLLTASAIGGIVKHNASISGGVGGCQAEVGTSAAMAAGALADIVGGLAPAVAFNAAEAALEQHLGSPCDPVGGLVEVPCIDRNVGAAVSAITVCRRMTRLGPGYAGPVPFDRAVRAMQDISLEMSSKYKETSAGGLALVMQEEVRRRRPDLFPDDAARAGTVEVPIPIVRGTC